MRFNAVIFLPLLTSVLMFMIGIITKRWYPKRINLFAGYRSRRSMASQEAWEFAQVYSAEISLKIAPFPAAIGMSAFFLPRAHWAVELFLALSIMLLSFLTLFVKTESKLKDRFGD